MNFLFHAPIIFRFQLKYMFFISSIDKQMLNKLVNALQANCRLKLLLLQFYYSNSEYFLKNSQPNQKSYKLLVIIIVYSGIFKCKYKFQEISLSHYHISTREYSVFIFLNYLCSRRLNIFTFIYQLISHQLAIVGMSD